MSGIPGVMDFVRRANIGDDVYTGSLAVDVFFVISGFLVTSSYLHRDDLGLFLKSRALRVLPAYAACLVLIAFGLGAIYTELPMWDYLTAPETRDYVITNMQLGDLRWTLPGVFTHNPHPNAVNGCLWTLPAELRMYAWVAILGSLGLLRRRWIANVTLGALCIIGIYNPGIMPQAAFLHLAGFFLFGAFCYVNRRWVPISDWLLLALVALTAISLHGPMGLWALSGTLAYGSLWFAYRPNFHFFNRFGNYSYGLYLWGFPIEQAVAHWFGVPTEPMLIFALSLPLALLCAILSWHLVEKPALNLKRSMLARAEPA